MLIHNNEPSKCEVLQCQQSRQSLRFFIIPQDELPLVVNVTCNIVSKLKVSPFHRVNSPLEAPVTNLLPSGVHWRRKNKKFIRKGQT
jgi:hypothetical protein